MGVKESYPTGQFQAHLTHPSTFPIYWVSICYFFFVLVLELNDKGIKMYKRKEVEKGVQTWKDREEATELTESVWAG